MPTHHHVHLHWHTEPGLLLGLLLVLGLYGIGVGPWRARLAPTTAFPSRQARRFGLGLVVLYVAIASPLDDLGERFLFSAHMVQHILLVYAVPMLLLTGTPSWCIRPLVRLPGVAAILRCLTQPLVAVAAFNLVFAAWHIPGLYEWALRDRLMHNLEHVTFLLTAVLMWWPILSPALPVPRLSPGAQVLYLLAVSVTQVPVFAYVTFANEVLYPTYALAPRLLPLTPMEDQQLGGIIMHVVSMGVLFTTLAVVFWRWYRVESPSPVAPAERTPAQFTPLHTLPDKAVVDNRSGPIS
jgi:putative membrane protein